MGKKLRMQRRGKGSNAYRKPPNTFKADVTFRVRAEDKLVGEVMEFIDDPGHTAPLMRVVYSNGTENILIAPEGIKIGDRISDGKGAEITLGSVVELAKVPDGMPVYNIEFTPGDGGKIARTAGSYATVLAHGENNKVNVFLPSKKLLYLDGDCRAEIGAAAGGGRDAQPIIKAGKNHYMKHAINARWPGNRGVKSNPVDHPFGGKQHHKGASSMVSRNAPPGAKVGHIAARRVGRKRGVNHG